MQQIPENIGDLWKRYVANQATEAEIDLLFQFIDSTSDEDPALSFTDLEQQKVMLRSDLTATMDDERINSMFLYAVGRRSAAARQSKVIVTRLWRWTAAAVLVLAIGAGWWFLNKGPDRDSPATAQKQDSIIQPGQTGAILTLNDGTQVKLDSLRNGVVASQSGIVAMMKDGKLYYEGTDGAIVYNTLTIPKGRLFHLTLSDGTEVWLNNASSIRYPTIFSGNKREVQILGEAFFDVARNKNRPFIVNVNNKAEVEVLGTSFNVNAFSNEESIKATLIDGAVRIRPVQSAPGTEALPGRSNQATDLFTPVILSAGQQARISNGNKMEVLNEVDVDKVLAWKNGVFNFKNIRFEEAMRQLERWYDIKVIYQNGIPDDIALGGEITRGVTLNELLEVLASVGIHCKLEDRVLTIIKK